MEKLPRKIVGVGVGKDSIFFFFLCLGTFRGKVATYQGRKVLFPGVRSEGEIVF